MPEKREGKKKNIWFFAILLRDSEMLWIAYNSLLFHVGFWTEFFSSPSYQRSFGINNSTLQSFWGCVIAHAWWAEASLILSILFEIPQSFWFLISPLFCFWDYVFCELNHILRMAWNISLIGFSLHWISKRILSLKTKVVRKSRREKKIQVLLWVCDSFGALAPGELRLHSWPPTFLPLWPRGSLFRLPLSLPFFPFVPPIYLMMPLYGRRERGK